jgi:signal transduction histidine kinase
MMLKHLRAEDRAGQLDAVAEIRGVRALRKVCQHDGLLKRRIVEERSMLRTFSYAIIDHRSERLSNAISLLLAIIGCGIDLLTGIAYSPLIFYVPSVIYAAWFCHPPIGWLSICLISASSLLVNSVDFDSVLKLEIELFNTSTRIATIILVYWIVRSLRRQVVLLRELNSRLQETDREKNKLFGVISHDLRSPFHAILGYAELLTRDAHIQKEERSRQYADNCFMAARTAYGLLENLLQWAQLQMKRVQLVPAVIETKSIIERCIDTHRPAAELKNVDLVIETIDPALTCFADFSAAETVLRNLTNNAIKYTPSGGRIGVGAQAKGDSVEFFVRDTGVGIAADRLDGLFMLAAAPPSPGTQGERGIGLGLMLCMDLIVRCGGRISVESAVGIGSCFRFTLPVPRQRISGGEIRRRP